MISRSSDKGFLAAHWDWLVAGAGVLALAAAAVVAVMAFGVDPETAADDALAELGGRSGGKSGIEPVSMDGYRLAKSGLDSPASIAAPDPSKESFLASGRRVFCEQGNKVSGEKSCGQPIPFGLKVCPFCGAKQPEEERVVLDSDGDGLPDEYEKEHGLNPTDPADAEADKDGDGFTNLEEFAAKTDPSDAASHPPYIDSLRLALPLNETFLPFYLEKVADIPSGHRFYFKNLNAKAGWDRGSTSLSVLKGEEIGKSGFSVKSYAKKAKKVAIKGSNVQKEVDVSTVELVRKSDGKTISLVINEKRTPVDVQAKLVYERGESKEFSVVPGDTVDLSGVKFRVVEITRVGKGARVVVENPELGKKAIEALEQ
ncbi:MAG: hypothetical protein IJI73_10485 [Kiritimatiellae bacterium]|nr:hypothetical protein [Kiritimatiellia bacterium]